ncbi:sensor histidine kinase KdpD [Listeria seeligeri]|uniref:sensor histidine kinase n=1 Tax=Listeria seeligeri TaxID=1640 RepID=UPI001628648C|nr:sensor histidine kinase KdpD [Listeria seeligeri]MBC1578615.1 sensor histidine kinase KdpD [Listeria seeligeri]MBC2219052.1 sensor histidine kinase KdpD [Listeria seeligeri]
METNRPSPEALLVNLQDEADSQVGKLKIYFGFAAGVGKTYAMLSDAKDQLTSGVDVVAGYIEPHARAETLKMLEGIPIIPPKSVNHKNISLKEFDLDEALKRKPELILVDELAHTNAEGVRNKKRFQDVEELLQAGIDVYTTVNVQHIESLNDIVEGITKVAVRETIPDYVFDEADRVKLIDIEPDELLKRLEQGKVYRPERAKTAMQNFFTRENLKLLREIAMRKAADRISHEYDQTGVYPEKRASSKWLVCIGSAPSSAKLIRWTARTAEAFRAPWIALYVENEETDYLSKQEKKCLRETMELAERLGAEIVTLAGHDIAETVAQYARLTGVTNIVVGKSRRRMGLRSLFEDDFEDQLITHLDNVDMHIIPSSSPEIKKRRMKMRFKSFLTWHDMAKMVLLLCLATAICIGLSELGIGDQNVIMVYILSVLIISRVTSGYVYGVLGSIIGVMLFNFFFTSPLYTFNTIQAGYPVTFGIMLLVALITSALTVRIKTQASLAVERERRTEVLYEINKRLLITRNLKGIIDLTNEYILHLFQRSVIFYSTDPAKSSKGIFVQAEGKEDASALLNPEEEAVAHWVFKNKKRAGAGTDTLMGAFGYYMPVMSQGKVLGVIGVSCSAEDGPLTQDNRMFLRMISSQVALALERQYLSEEQRQIVIESAKEKMRSNLLRAISHDLRTPLTGIIGASSALLEKETELDKATQHDLIKGIKDDSGWLIRMVENLLSVTRISEGLVSLEREPEAVEEIVGEAVGRIKKRFTDRIIHVQVPRDLLMVPMDGTLIEQVLINLMENALRHAGADAEVWVDVTKTEKSAIFSVRDNGTGIPENRMADLFDTFAVEARERSDMSRGLGLGLSICMSIIRAHDGTIEAKNNELGGATFWFTLPLDGGDEQ